MTVNWRVYGEPPIREECTEIGTVPAGVAPETLDNVGSHASKESMLPHYGKDIPPVRRCWMVVAYYRNKDVPVPYSVRIPGLGTLVYGRDKWDGDCWQLFEEGN